MGFLEALDRSTAGVVRGLELRSKRHGAIAANVANGDTPGYRAVDVSFGTALQQAGLRMTSTHPAHLQAGTLPATDALVLTGGMPRRDGNDVEVDREMAKLAANQIDYQFLARALSGRFKKLKDAITGRAS